MVMAAERRDNPTPHGGAYSIATWMDLERWVETEKADATGVIFTEYSADGEVVFESVAKLEPEPVA